ncbi:MAG: UV DNA damage repair endonuclease UvsE [Candidatus Lokiarchaeota archaeon]|nr:UV DNA damage repair endonuclease UvsE [Candidatus Lokiarchaeota archaeon]
MKIGYPCINLSLECRSSRTFRLKNYSIPKLKSTISNNLKCLQKILEFNKKHGILFFRITSDLIPFASHEIMKFEWQEHFKQQFREIGEYLKCNEMRITMHPGQYTVLNSTDEGVFKRSVKEIRYHIEVLDIMGLDSTAKVQVHVGGVYGNKPQSLERFIERYKTYNKEITNRLVIENDDKSYTLQDCLKIHDETGIPIIFDIYHHQCNSSGESIPQAFKAFTESWKEVDGLPIVHYSSEHPDKGKPRHSEHIQLRDFRKFIEQTREYNFDMMLEIKDKEKSALKALEVLNDDERLAID